MGVASASHCGLIYDILKAHFRLVEKDPCVEGWWLLCDLVIFKTDPLHIKQVFQA